MADILIRGMEMPKDNNATSIIIFSNGKVSLAHDKKYAEYAEAVPLPEGHGELIERNTLIDEFTKSAKAGQLKPWSIVKTAPTIVPAEGGGEDG